MAKLKITVERIAAGAEIWMNYTDVTAYPEFTGPLKTQLNITGIFSSVPAGDPITGATVELLGAGVNSSYFEYFENGNAYTFVLNTTMLFGSQ